MLYEGVSPTLNQGWDEISTVSLWFAFCIRQVVRFSFKAGSLQLLTISQLLIFYCKYTTNILCTAGFKTRGWGLLSPKSYVDVPAGPWKSDFLYTNFLPSFPPISLAFLKEKHQILTKLGALYYNLPKIHPIYVIWAPLSLMKTPDHHTKFCEKVPQKAGTYMYTMSMWEPPGSKHATFIER